MEISVILCSYNPRPEYIKRTLESLKNQTLSKDRWDLLIVDNNSNPPIQELVDISWHPKGRIVIEEKQGLAYSKIRGINETDGDLIIFVDDDNILENNYLFEALRIKDEWTILGTFGGSISGSFESPPTSISEKYLNWIAVRELESD